MYSTREDIKTALDVCRAHIAGRHRRALEVYGAYKCSVQLATQAELDSEDWGNKAEDMGVDCFGSVMGRNDARRDQVDVTGHILDRGKPSDGEVEPWAWRYIAYGPDDEKTFDTIPELLEWYSRHREREVPDIDD
ncbi:hypothetical protein CCUS01_00033 [Colletotrichum cuscutae]|uniref:Uncharacterized protein n=1 Tax=Colletotrichum cuscutae TaxID=1209917 RepID=A0AAI9YDQ8_9PEZI|nr:hypothetical protein CCUS01_00033 [Colletotrichum cuscutae]